MPLRLSHMTLVDETLTHQVRFSSAYGSQVQVSCNCRKTVGKHEKAGKLIYDPIGLSRNIDESRQLYNDPDNHWAPFDSEVDRAKW